MQLTTFLSTLVPPGVLVAGKLVPKVNLEGEAYSAFSHAASRLYTDLADNLVRMDAEKRSAYFALAAYKQGFHESPPDPKTGKTKKQLRVRTNVDSLKALWFDIDFKGKKGEPPLYPDVKSAVTALAAFCKATKMPPPALLVGTGNGIHVYWPIDEPVPLDRWQRLADALKTAAIEKGLDIDPVCTADACRVLRPIGTSNWKDPANPKPVQLLHATGKLFTYGELESVLMPWVGARRGSVTNTVGNGLYTEITGASIAGPNGTFANIIKHCGVASMIADTHGKECSEPLWTWSLQLLKHCEDGPMWVHPISNGHPGYNEAATEKKWQQRLANTAGPTLCTTFEQYEPAICAKCPRRGRQASPISLGEDDVHVVGEMPHNWRIAPNNSGVERLMIDANNQKVWQKQMRYVPTNLRVTQSTATSLGDMSFDVSIHGTPIGTISMPISMLGNDSKMKEFLAGRGMVLRKKEVDPFVTYMNTWLENLQAARLVADVNEQLGWIMEKLPDKEILIGFSCGEVTYHADGRESNDVRTSRDYAAIAKHYEPKGSLSAWKKVAAFLAEQNKPAFTAILAAAFGTPLLRFTGLSGAILSIVSTASGVGKSSALKCSQAVWGSPTHGVNQVDDTPKSVAKKLGFLNNLPAYWDELRGKKVVDDFLNLAFQTTAGKERTRLDSSAQLRETSTWETMLVVASNESIFEAMARHGGGSDAGIVRTFEIVVEPFTTERNKAELSMMFEALNANYGHAGRVYAKYLAMNAEKVGKRVQDMYAKLAAHGSMKAAERFWFAMMALLIVGAQIAGELDLVKINVTTLAKFLMDNVDRLRGRSAEVMMMSGPQQVLAGFMRKFHDCLLTVEKFPSGSNHSKYEAVLSWGAPRSGKMFYQMSYSEQLLRIPRDVLDEYTSSRGLSIHNTLRQMKIILHAKEMTVELGIGTTFRQPAQKVLQFKMADLGIKPDELIVDDPSNSVGSPGSPSPTPPAGSPPGSNPP